MGKSTAATSPTPTKKASKQPAAKRATSVAKAKTKTPARKALAKSASIAAKKSPSTARANKNAAKSKRKAPPPVAPMPKGWPVASKFSYPTPRTAPEEREEDTYPAAIVDKKSNDTKGIVVDVDTLNSDVRDCAGVDSAPTAKSTLPTFALANYLAPGSLLRQSCNGSDVFLKKQRVVHPSTSASFPSVVTAASSSRVTGGEVATASAATNKGGPTRFLIVFPGRMSLKPPPASPSPRPDDEDDGDDGDEDNEGPAGEKDGGTKGLAAGSSVKKRNPFAPTNPPQLLGTLSSLGGDERRMELRIPFPTAADVDTTGADALPRDNDTPPSRQLVMSGRAVPLSGKYMAISFKRGSGGGRDSSASSKPAHKKLGTGSILCKDVFRSVIVLGESELVDGEGRAVAPGADEGKQGSDEVGRSEAEDEEQVVMKHYGGSERTLDGGGVYNGGVAGARKSLKGASPAAARKRRAPCTEFGSESSGDGESSTSDDSEDASMEDQKEGDSDNEGSDGEFVPPTVAGTADVKKKQRPLNSIGTARGDEKTEEMASVPVGRKRTPRRSAAKANNVSYVDESSDVDMVHLSSDGEESNGSSSKDSSEDQDDNIQSKSKPVKKNSLTKKAATKTASTKKTKAMPDTIARNGGTCKKSMGVRMSSDGEDDGSVGSVGSDNSNFSNDDDKDRKETAGSSKAKPKASNEGSAAKIASKREEIVGTTYTNNVDNERETEEVSSTPKGKKRTPRRSAAKANNVSYIEERSDVDMVHLSSNEENSDGSRSKGCDKEDDDKFQRKFKPARKKSTARKPVSNNAAAKKRKASTAAIGRKSGAPQKKIAEMSVDLSSDEEDKDSKSSKNANFSKDDDEEEEKVAGSSKAKPKTKVKKSGANRAGSATNISPQRGNSINKDKKTGKVSSVPAGRKRTPRRSAAKANNVSYIDESSDLDTGHLSSDGEESDGSSSYGNGEEEGKNGNVQRTSKPAKRKPTVKKAAATTAAAKKRKASAAAVARKDVAPHKKIAEMNIHMSSDEEDKNSKSSNEDDNKEKKVARSSKAKPKTKAKALTAKNAGSVTKKSSKRKNNTIESGTNRKSASEMLNGSDDDGNKFCDVEEEEKEKESNNETSRVKKPEGKRRQTIKNVASKAAKESVSTITASKKRIASTKSSSHGSNEDKENTDQGSKVIKGDKTKGKTKKKKPHSARVVTKTTSAAKGTSSIGSTTSNTTAAKRKSDNGVSTEPATKRGKNSKMKKSPMSYSSPKRSPQSPTPQKRSTAPISSISMKSPISVASSATKSPIARGRRKKKSPPRPKRNHRKEDDLNMDDDPFTFL